MKLVSYHALAELVMVVKGNTVSAFFDESGKFKDKKVVCFGGVSSYNEDFVEFGNEWGRLLARNGIKVLSGKDAFRHKRPLSSKNRRIGIDERIDDLLPFIACIRKHLLVITAITFDVATFQGLPTHFFESYGHDPVLAGFARALLKVIEFTHGNDKIVFVCDDDEEMGVAFFRIWRRIKTLWRARNKLVAISFADDRFLFALQAADFVSSLIRLEAGKRFLKIEHDYGRLVAALEHKPERHERIWELQIAFGDKPTLITWSEALEESRKKALENEQNE